MTGAGNESYPPFWVGILQVEFDADITYYRGTPAGAVFGGHRREVFGIEHFYGMYVFSTNHHFVMGKRNRRGHNGNAWNSTVEGIFNNSIDEPISTLGIHGQFGASVIIILITMIKPD